MQSRIINLTNVPAANYTKVALVGVDKAVELGATGQGD
jgi:hypothetical protein